MAEITRKQTNKRRSQVVRHGDTIYLAGQVGIPHGVKVGRGAAVLNGAYVQKDLPDYGVIAGPAGEVRPYASHKLHKLISCSGGGRG